MPSQINWQDYVAILFVALAGLYLARRLFGTMRPTAGGGCAKGCSSCPSSKASAMPTTASTPNLVQIGPGQRPTRGPTPDTGRNGS